MTTSVQEIIREFQFRFNKIPRIFFSPGRINLIGEHIDYNDGFVMPAAIDKGVWFALAKNETDNINIFSADMKEWLKINVDEIKKMTGWKNYLLGVIDVLQKRNFTIKGFDCVFGGNIPVGAGLSSSAAVECGLGKALSELFELNIESVNIALIGQKAEHTLVGVQCGIMDQFANMMSEKDKVLLLDCNTLEYEKLPLQLNDYEIVLINSKVHHSLASGEYNIRRKQSEEGLQILKQHFSAVKTFRDVKPEDVISIKNNFQGKAFDRCLFVTQEIERTKKAAVLLKENNLKAFGVLMFEAHKGLSKLYEVSCAELDFLAEEAKKYSEIIGARMMGGGFGGCTINIIKKENADAIIEKITSAYKGYFNIAAEVYRVKLSDGTHEISL
jgi:galactokinase